MRGRKRVPSVMAELHGNPGKRRAPRAEPTAPRLDQPPPPEHLGADAAREWATILGALRAAGIATTLDFGLLEAWASARGDFVRAEREMRDTGPVTLDRDGVPRRSPWFLVKARAVDQMLRIASEFGLSPASRPRIGRVGASAITSVPDVQRPGDKSLAEYLASRPRGLQ